MLIPKKEIFWLVGNLHVSTTDIQVVRNLHFRMTLRKKFPKAFRKAVYRYALETHHKNRELYRDVMRGNLH